ncbi:MAG: hypothetical protein ACRDR6_10875 [Pseudonocardiaceae bacterium]
MATPEQVTRRIASHDETLRVMGDDLVEIRETLDQHTQTLAEHGRKLDSLETRVTEGFAEILRRLDAR